MLRDLSDDELLNLTDLVLFERQRQHVETLREKVRYVDRLTAFLEREGKFGVGDIFTEELGIDDTEEKGAGQGTSKEGSYKGKGKAKEVEEPELGNRSSPSHSLLYNYNSDLPPPLPSSYGVFPTPPPSIVSFYQPLYTPHQAGGARYSLQALNDPAHQICGPLPAYKPSSKNTKGKEKEKTNGNSKRKNKGSDPEIEKRWVSYCQSRFRYQWEMAQADSEIMVLEAAVEAVLQRRKGEITGGGGLRRETLFEVNRLRNLRMGKAKKEGSLHAKATPEASGKRIEGSIMKLPTELLHQIFSYFRPHHLASSHALVCRRWNYIATPIIYRKIPFGDYMEDYWVEVGRRKRLWKKKQEKKVKSLGAEKPYEIPRIYDPLYNNGHRVARTPSAAWTMRYGHGLRHDCHSEQDEDDDSGYNDEEDFYPDGKQGGTFPIGGPALVVMPWSMGIIRAISNPHLAKHVRQIDYQASSYTSFPNHNEAGKVFSDLTDTRPMLDQRFRTLEKLVQLVRKAVRQCTRVEVLKLNSGDERISNALLGLLKWSPKLESLSIINTNLRLLQFSRGSGKCQEGLISRGDGKGKGIERPREVEGLTIDEGLNLRQYLLDSQNLSEPQRGGLRIKVKAKGPPGDDFYLPSLKRILFFRCGYHPQPQKDIVGMEPPVRIPPPRPTDRVQASRDRERRRRRRFRFRAKIARGEKRALEKVVLFLQRCNNLEELKVKGCQFLPEALVDSALVWEIIEDENESVEEYPLTLNKLSTVTIRSCGTYLHDRTPEIWLSSPPFERFFLRHKAIRHLGWNGWILNRHLPLEDSVFSRVATHLGRTVTSLSIAHGYDEEVSRTAPDSLHRVRLSLKRFNLLLRHLRQLETLEWRMFHLPVGKMMMGIRNLRRCPKMKNLRIEGVIGVISQDEARELVACVPLLEKLRIRWRPRPVGYRRGRAAPGMGPLPPIWGDEVLMEYESSPSPPQIPPSPDVLNYAMPPPPPPPALMDSDFEDDDWGGELRREPEWVAAEEVARIFADAKHLRELYVNILISMPVSMEKHIASMDLRIADEILRPTRKDSSGPGGPTIAYQLRKSWLEKIRETAVAFARNSPSSVRKIGLGYFVGVQGLNSVVTLDRNPDGKVVGWSADLKGGRKVGEMWREGVDAGLASSGDSWMDGAFKEVEEKDWSETRNWAKARVPTRPFRR